VSEPSGWADRPVKAARAGLLALAAFLPVAVLAGLLVEGREGVVGALLGSLVPAVVLLLTWGAAELGARRSATAFAGLMLGSYLLKLVLVGAGRATTRASTTSATMSPEMAARPSTPRLLPPTCAGWLSPSSP